MKNKLTLTTLATLAGFAGAANADVIISGMVDGTQTGGIPKAMEIAATAAVSDLSDFWVVRDTNGAGPFDTFAQLPSVSLASNDFFYVYGNSDTTTSMTTLGFPATSGNALEDGILNWNGDDILGLATPNGTFSDGTDISQFDVISSFGLVGQGDTDFAANSISYLTGANSAAGITDAGNFTITAYSDTDLQSTFGTYVVPEPSAYALLSGMLGLAWVMLRRRRA
jgi:hypothetical protein